VLVLVLGPRLIFWVMCDPCRAVLRNWVRIVPSAFRSVFTLNSASYHWMPLPRLETWHPGSHWARDENSRASWKHG
jgi:hypothetical protein